MFDMYMKLILDWKTTQLNRWDVFCNELLRMSDIVQHKKC